MYKGILFLLLIISLLAGCGKPRLNENDAQKFLNYFYNDKVPEEITDRHLLTAGRGIVPYLIDEVQKRDMPKRGYAIGALGKLGDRRALPVLIKILVALSSGDLRKALHLCMSCHCCPDV